MQYVSGEWVDAPVVQQAKPVEQPEKRMVAVLPFIEKEMDQVESFLKRSLELCGVLPRTLYLLPFRGLDTKEVRIWPESAFSQVGIIQDSEGKTSDWQGGELIRDAAGPNSLFRQASWFFYTKKIGPWLWLEPDCWPMTDRWFYDLEREYFETGKPFMGVKMASSDGREYMNGVAVYPWNAVQYAPFLIQASTWTQHPEMEVGFDIAGGKDVLAKAHITRKIQLMGALAGGNANVRPETVLCHGRIDLSSSSQLREDAGGFGVPAGGPNETSGTKVIFHRDDPDSNGPAKLQTLNPQTAAQKPFLDRYGVDNGVALNEKPHIIEECQEINGIGIITNALESNNVFTVLPIEIGLTKETEQKTRVLLGAPKISNEPDYGSYQIEIGSGDESRLVDVLYAERLIQQSLISTITVTKSTTYVRWAVNHEPESQKKLKNVLCSVLTAIVSYTTKSKDFLGQDMVRMGNPATEVFGDASPHAAPCVPSHETPVQETPSQSKNNGVDYGALSKRIRDRVQDLVGIWDQQPHRKVLIVKELRKAKLVPKHFR